MAQGGSQEIGFIPLDAWKDLFGNTWGHVAATYTHIYVNLQYHWLTWL